MEYEDVIKTKTGYIPSTVEPEVKLIEYPLLEDLPKTLDWRVHGVLPFPKD